MVNQMRVSHTYQTKDYHYSQTRQILHSQAAHILKKKVKLCSPSLTLWGPVVFVVVMLWRLQEKDFLKAGQGKDNIDENTCDERYYVSAKHTGLISGTCKCLNYHCN